MGQYKPTQPLFYKTSGELIRELSLAGVTDSYVILVFEIRKLTSIHRNGMFALFDYTAF